MFFRRRNNGKSCSNRSNIRSSMPMAPISSQTDADACPVYTCHACRRPILSSNAHVHTNRPVGERRYHTECFRCMQCHEIIVPTKQAFCFDESNGKEGRDECQFHRECYAEFFGWKCVVCEQPLPVTDNGLAERDKSAGAGLKFEFLKHPFFEGERMCPHHMQRDTQGGTLNSSPDSFLVDEIGGIRRCTGCHRFEPLFSSLDKHFIDLGDANRCVCMACFRTVVTNSDDALPLWEKVINFFEGPLGLITSNDKSNGVSRQKMESIPILVVDSGALNENLKEHSLGKHFGSSQIMTRGLCLSERVAQSNEPVGVTAVLCLSGLPADLTASILAHEATHAWIKLHPLFQHGELPNRVEEGICQLVAFLFLNDGLEPFVESESSDNIPSDSMLRQYFKFCIETDESTYGEGFRLAARAYAEMGIEQLLYYVALNHDFPVID